MISEEQCLTALKEYKNNKTPGTDGFSAEFYKFFWSDPGTEMTASFNYAFQKGSLSISQKCGIISLIPKKNKDKTLLENLRPISLLNDDYKILTKYIAKRLEKVLYSLRSKRFQSSYCAKVRADAIKRMWKEEGEGEGEGRRGNACPQTPRF